MTTPKIVSADVGKMPASMFDAMPVITATFDDGTKKELFSYYPDEIQFSEAELIGLTEAEVGSLRVKKDVRYLQS